uniref:Uncharacterized protein n=1 Tax=Arundo donax TaxID=35708 RepID=A0A0A9G849_ARUDO
MHGMLLVQSKRGLCWWWVSTSRMETGDGSHSPGKMSLQTKVFGQTMVTPMTFQLE